MLQLQPHATPQLLQRNRGGVAAREASGNRRVAARRAAAKEQPPASSSEQEEADELSQQPGVVADRAFPKSGLFSIADPKAEVYSKAGEVFDPTKKGGRWKPEFIWQTNWQEQLKRQEDLERQQAEYRQQQAAGGPKGGTGPGVVSFSRLGSLNDPALDLSQQLAAAAEKARREQQRRAAAGPPAAPAAAASAVLQQPQAGASGRPPAQAALQQAQARRGPGASPSYQYKDLPTKNEARRFRRASRLAAPGTVASINAVGALPPEEQARRAAAAAAERARYEQLKVEFQAWAIALGALGSGVAYFTYSKDIAISYALGASGGLTYLRLLGRSVDSIGDSGAGGGVSSALGQPRLLIPVLLALTYNRWNVLYADEYGFGLNFFGMLVGFLTYKLAVLGRQGLALFAELRDGPASTAQGGAGGGEGGGEGGEDAMSLDRIFVKRVISG